MSKFPNDNAKNESQETNIFGKENIFIKIIKNYQIFILNIKFRIYGNK